MKILHGFMKEGYVKILDRRIYRERVEFVICNTHNRVSNTIRDMVTQSAGPISAVGMGMALAGFMNVKIYLKMSKKNI